MTSFRKKLLFSSILTFIFLGIIIGSIAIIELYCAYSYFKYRDTLKGNINVIRLREPFINVDETTEFNGNIVRFRTDSNAFILPHTPFDSSNVKIAFVGGSTTECRNVTEENRIHVRTAKLLSENKIISTCFNIGNSGNNSMHAHDLLVNKILSYEPKYVVYNHNVNDLSTLLNCGTYWNNNKHRSLLIKDSDYLFDYRVGFPKNYFVRKYIPYISLVLLPTTFEGETLPNQIEFNEEFIQGLSEEFLLSAFKSSLKANMLLIRSFGAEPILCTQASCFKHYELPEKVKSNEYNIVKLHALFNDVIRKVALELNIELVDLEAKFINNKEFFYDTVHYTNQGSIAVSEEIYKAIKNKAGSN